MEADFRREYGIRLREALRRMSWREFMVLIRGLGPQSALVLTVRSGTHRDRRGQVVETMTTTAAAEARFNAIVGPPGNPSKVQ